MISYNPDIVFLKDRAVDEHVGRIKKDPKMEYWEEISSFTCGMSKSCSLHMDVDADWCRHLLVCL